MGAEHFRDIKEQGTEIFQQMSFIVEKGQDAVLSESHRTSREALTSKMEAKAAKQLAKYCLEKAGKKGKGCNSDAT